MILPLLLSSCNKDEVIEASASNPVITFDSATGVYTVKSGRTITIEPTVTNADGATYTWTIDTRIVSRTRQLSISFSEPQTVYATLLVVTGSGAAEEEIEIDVTEASAPLISLPVPDGGIKLLPATDYLLSPDFRFDDEDFSCLWTLGGSAVSTERSYTFSSSGLGSYELSLSATNADGTTTLAIPIEVVSQLPYSVSFDKPYFAAASTDRSAVVGRPIYINPQLTGISDPAFSWTVDGTVVAGADGAMLKYTPTTAGDHSISVSVSGNGGQAAATARLTVHCYATEGTLRQYTSGSSLYQSAVFEYLPAPGQYIGDATYAAFTGSELTMADATAYAYKRMSNGKYVSLGAFGGYVIVGFDHSISNSGGSYDFSITGNAFAGSSEPGVVWVMQDTNGNGLPDDEWYELQGSEAGLSTTLTDYAVTYYRPASGCPVHWTDSNGASGSVDYLGEYHSQSSYYPAWVEADSYTLRGTRLAANNSVDASTGYWSYTDLAYGYADNYGSDRLDSGNQAGSCVTGFKLSRAVHRDGTPVQLSFIDFVKVQTAVNAKSGIIGECSTEVINFTDIR
jgi:hypothetical protein